MLGHGYIIICRTKNIVCMGVIKNNCSICTATNSRQQPDIEHKCQINWDGSIGAIYTRVASDLCIKLHNEEYNICIQHTVSDDDSTMRAHLLHESDGGKLSEHIPSPNFPVDPSHWIKVMAKPLFKVAKSESNNPEKCKKIDALRLKIHRLLDLSKSQLTN